MAYPLEALLRPAHELRSACASALGAGVVIGAPGLFLLSRPWDWLLAGALVSHAAWRGVDVIEFDGDGQIVVKSTYAKSAAPAYEQVPDR